MTFSTLTTNNTKEVHCDLIAQWEEIILGGYVDGVNGKDTNTGATPSDPVKTFKQAYTNLAKKGGTIYVVNTVTIDSEMELSKTYYKDNDGMVTLDSSVTESGGEFNIKRYSKPTATLAGYDVSSNLAYMIKVSEGGILQLGDITIDGHDQAITEGSENIVAPAVKANGAILYIDAKGIVNITDAILTHNTSTQNGGGVCVASEGKLVVNGGSITHNTGKTNGGGVRNDGIMELLAGSVSENVLTETYSTGGGIYSTGTITVKGGTVSKNDARSGCGIYNDGTMEMSAGVISGNVPSVNYGSGSGVYNNGIFTLSGGTIKDNYSSQYGAGIYNNGTMTMTNGTIENNRSSRGSGIYNSKSLTISGGNITKNIPSGSSSIAGIGIYNGGTEFVMTGGSITDNGNTTDKYEGGGIVNNSLMGSTAVIKGGTISGNQAKNGGAIYCFDGELTIEDGEFTNNNAQYGGCIYLANLLSDSFTITGGTFSGNAATRQGGVLHNESKGSVSIEGGEFTENSSDMGAAIMNISTLELKGGAITLNTASGSGGAIFNQSGATLSMIDGDIADNKASASGGGVGNAGTFTMAGGDVQDNYAKNKGGGVYNSKSFVYTGGTINGNDAKGDGDGVYQGDTMNMEGYATVDLNNDVYLASEKYVTITNAITAEEKVAALKPSDYTYGRTCAKTDYQDEEGNAAKASTAYEYFKLVETGAAGKRFFRPGDYLNDDAGIADTDVIISTSYEVTYYQNLDGVAVTDIPEAQRKYWNEDFSISDLIPTCDSHLFLGWSEDQSNDDTAYQPSGALGYAKNNDVKLYAKWRLKAYDITYMLKEEEQEKNHPDNPSKYTPGIGVPEFKEPTKPGYEFKGWYEDPSLTTPIISIPADRTGDVTLYPKWSELIIVVYNGNEADRGTLQSEVVSELEIETYSIKENEGFTDYEKDQSDFAGWDKLTYTSPSKVYFPKDSLPKEVTFDELKTLARDDVEVQQYTRGKNRYVTNSLALAGTSTVNGVENVPVLNLYAVWDMAPELSADSVLEFYEGEYVTKEMLLENLEVFDDEDESNGKPLTKDDIRIVSVKYLDGKLKSGVDKNGHDETWEQDVPDDFTLHTWFLEIEPPTGEEERYITYEVIYAVTDSAGNETKFPWTVKVKYNEFPVIDGEDRYFTLEEAQEGKITLEELMSRARAWDKEDCEPHLPGGSLSSGNTCLGKENVCEFGERLTLLGFRADKFTSYEDSGYEVLSYHVIDQYGKESLMQFTVYVVKDGEIVEPDDPKMVRFINKKYYDINVGVLDTLPEDDPNTTDVNEREDAIKEFDQKRNGGLYVASLWYTKESYRTLIQSVLSDTPTVQETWEIPVSDLETIKDYIKAHGVGNYNNGLEDFYQTFKKYIK